VSASGAAQRYDAQVSNAADVRLAELFIFIDPATLRRICVASFFAIALLIFLLLGSWLLALLAGAVVMLAPTLGVTLLRRARIRRFSHALPDALQSLANMLRSGLNLSGALEFIVDDDKGPVGQEFGLFLNELKMGVKFEQALDNMYLRVPTQDMQLVVAGLKISREIGGSLADVMARLADTIRRRLEMEGKIDSLTAMGKLQGLVMTLLPMGVGYAIFKIEPEAMMKMFTTWHGWIACAVVLLLEVAGFYVIRKIVSIDV
jgi:tight adherence protein B